MTRLRLLLGATGAVLAGCSVQTAAPDSTVALLPLATTTTTVAETTTTTTPRDDGWFVVSVTAELPAGVSTGLAMLDRVDVVSVVRVGNAALVETRAPDGSVVDRALSGFSFPFEVHVIDPQSHAGYVPEPVAGLLAGLDADEVLLSESSASFRRLGVGGQLELEDGIVLTVAGVVGDEWVGAAEAAVNTAGGEALGIERSRYAIVRFDGSRQELEQAAAGFSDAPVRVRSREEVDVFRHADAVASQIAIKTMFGEFAFRPTQGDFIEIDPAWLDANIVELEIPLLGNDKCHRRFVAMLSEVMLGLEDEGLADVIDPSAYLGCWNSRFIRGRRDLSRHAWGVAADINFGNEPDGTAGSPTHPALLDAMLERDIRSGHNWTSPDPGHFEWYGPAGS